MFVFVFVKALGRARGSKRKTGRTVRPPGELLDDESENELLKIEVECPQFNRPEEIQSKIE